MMAAQRVLVVSRARFLFRGPVPYNRVPAVAGTRRCSCLQQGLQFWPDQVGNFLGATIRRVNTIENDIPVVNDRAGVYKRTVQHRVLAGPGQGRVAVVDGFFQVISPDQAVFGVVVTQQHAIPDTRACHFVEEIDTFDVHIINEILALLAQAAKTIPGGFAVVRVERDGGDQDIVATGVADQGGDVGVIGYGLTELVGDGRGNQLT